MTSQNDTPEPTVETWDGIDVPAIVTVAPIGPDLFVGRFNQVNFYDSLFGGQVLGQSIAAAAATVENRSIHSMHGYFLRPGAGDRPVEYFVERTRDGRSFTTRRVTGTQVTARGRETIFQMECSFHVEEPGWDHQSQMPDVPPPEALEDLVAIARAAEPAIGEILMRRSGRHGPLEIRPVRPDQVLTQQKQSRRQAWFRAPSAAGVTDPAVQLQILAWISDFSLSGAALVMHTVPLPGPHVFLASIDHAMWFHRPVRTGEWLLLDTDSPSASGATGLSRGLIYDRSGRLVATVAQESLQRQID
ncbi:MAG: acyl-CoA thioesterase [Janthinobacterium lividum]